MAWFNPLAWVRATAKQLLKLGVAPEKVKSTKRYIPAKTKRVTRSTKQISVRKYQEGQQDVTLEERAEQYKAGTRVKKHYQAETKYPKKVRHRVYMYHNVAWEDVPKYFKRFHGKKVQMKMYGENVEGYKDKGPRWISTVSANGDLKDIYDKINATEYAGFSSTNPPKEVSFYVRPR